MEELKTIMEKFASSGWDLIAVPAQQWLDGKGDNDTLVSAIKRTRTFIRVPQNQFGQYIML